MRQRVTILSTLVPCIGDLTERLDWRLWDGGAFPATTADVVIVCRPLELLGRMHFDHAAGHLIDAAFGGGAVYDAADTLAMLEAHRLALHR